MAFSSLLQWLPSIIQQENLEQTSPINAAKWRILADAKHKRLPLILYSTADHVGGGYQSMVLKVDQKHNTCFIDMPLPALPSDHMALPKRIYATLKYPGSYQHWQITGELIERAQAADGPYFKYQLESMQFCKDRRRQARFNFSDTGNEVSCTPAMETPIYGNIDNISMGGICFNARGNLLQSNAFYLAQQGRKTFIPATIQLNADEQIQVDLVVLSMQVNKKPYLHTRVRASFNALNQPQAHILAALTEKLADTA